jgi:hypothetical protein
VCTVLQYDHLLAQLSQTISVDIVAEGAAN